MKRIYCLILVMGTGMGVWANSPQNIVPQTLPVKKANAAQFIQYKLQQQVRFSGDYSTLVISPSKNKIFKVQLFDLNVDQLLLTADGKVKLSCKKERPLCFHPIGFEGNRMAYQAQLALGVVDTSDVNRLKKAFQDLVKSLKEQEKLRFGY